MLFLSLTVVPIGRGRIGIEGPFFFRVSWGGEATRRGSGERRSSKNISNTRFDDIFTRSAREAGKVP